MKNCHIEKDIEKLESFAAIFASPMSFAWHVGKDLVVNGVDIYHEIKTSVTDFEAGKWEDFGFNVGEATAKLILGKQS